MKNITLSIIITLFTLSLTSCFTQEKDADASGGSTVSADAPVRWPSSSLTGGINIKISPDFSANKSEIVDMFEQWNNATTAETFFQTDQEEGNAYDHASLNSFRDNEMGVYRSSAWFSDVKSTVLAVTQYYGYRRNSGSASEYIEITHADIIMNYKDFAFSTDASDSSSYDFESVILHELGHFLGLGHTSSFSIDSVMRPSLGSSSSKRIITAYDKASIVELYGGSSALTAQTHALSASRAVALENKKIVLPKAARQISSDGEIHGLIELHADGKCLHKENGKVVEVHDANLH